MKKPVRSSLVIIITIIASIILALQKTTTVILSNYFDFISNNNNKRHKSSSSSSSCMHDVDTIVASHSSTSSPIFITMPAKAAGTTMKAFARKCGGQAAEHNRWFDLVHPKTTILASHLTRSNALQDLIEQQDNNSNTSGKEEGTIFYIHRKEQDRLESATHHVLKKLCSGRSDRPSKVRTTALNASHCQVPEVDLQEMIRRQEQELLYGQEQIWTCGLHNAILQKKKNVNLYVIHYQHVNLLQKALSKRYCPELMERSAALRENVGKGNQMTIEVIIGDDNTTTTSVELEAWIQVNRNQYLREKPPCHNQTQQMEEELFQCSSELISIR